MGTPLSELIADLATDYGDPTLDEAVAERAIVRALALLNADLSQAYRVVGAAPDREIDPELGFVHRELLLLRALAFLVRIRRTGSATTISFKSGNKQVTRSASNWQELERDLLEEYWRRVKQENPDAGDGNVYTWNVPPVLYSRGSDLE